MSRGCGELSHIFQDDPIDKAIGRTVVIACWSCQHVVERPAQWLADLATEREWSRIVIEIGEKLVCSKCGKHWPGLTFK